MCKESVCKCSPGFRHIRGKCVPKETPEATTPLIIDCKYSLHKATVVLRIETCDKGAFCDIR